MAVWYRVTFQPDSSDRTFFSRALRDDVCAEYLGVDDADREIWSFPCRAGQGWERALEQDLNSHPDVARWDRVEVIDDTGAQVTTR